MILSLIVTLIPSYAESTHFPSKNEEEKKQKGESRQSTSSCHTTQKKAGATQKLLDKELSSDLQLLEAKSLSTKKPATLPSAGRPAHHSAWRAMGPAIYSMLIRIGISPFLALSVITSALSNRHNVIRNATLFSTI